MLHLPRAVEDAAPKIKGSGPLGGFSGIHSSAQQMAASDGRPW